MLRGADGEHAQNHAHPALRLPGVGGQAAARHQQDEHFTKGLGGLAPRLLVALHQLVQRMDSRS
eukprot:3290431-Prymnesium_polylepis.1